MPVTIREMTIADVPAGLDLCRASGWNQTSQDWEFFLSAAPHGALVAVAGDSVVGTVASLPFGPFAWISMVIVDPAARGRGIGTLLLDRGLALVPEGSTARLDATPAGEAVYRKRGFVAEYPLARLFLDARARLPEPTIDARPLAKDDWPALLAMDADIFGASRAGLLRRLAVEAPERAWVVDRDGRLRGYVCGRRGHERDQVGPLVAEDDLTARALLDACLGARARSGLFIDVPDYQEPFRARLAQLGFRVERRFLRMCRGRLDSPGQPARVYAITGPEFG